MKIHAPFSPEQVDVLNRYQVCGVMHPFTCGGDGCDGLLIACPWGWVCPRCSYTQGWAHDWMADAEIVATLEKGLEKGFQL